MSLDTMHDLMIAELRDTTDLCVRGVRPEGTKIERIMAQSNKLEAGRLLIPKVAPWLDDFLDEYRAFPRGKHDDILDAVTYGLDSRKNVVSPDARVYSGKSAYAEIAHREFGFGRREPT